MASNFSSQNFPNILITGTPGTGKSTLAESVASATNFRHVNVGDLVKEKELHEGWDEEFEAWIMDEDKICDELEDLMTEGKNIVDFHSCGFFPERWFDLVIVLRTDNTVLYPRLEKRSYSEKKITENITCEIMQVVLEEARESYAKEIVHELKSDTVEDMENNIEMLVNWIEEWKKNKGNFQQ